MDNQTIFLALIAVFVAVSAAALIFQAAMLYGTYKASRELRDRIVPLISKVDALVDTSRTTLVDITAKTNQILDVAKQQLETVGELIEDASLRTHRQLENAEIMVEDALARAQETVALVHKGILAPIRGINGVAAGVRAALQFLMRGTRPSPDQVTVDEEMFI